MTAAPTLAHAANQAGAILRPAALQTGLADTVLRYRNAGVTLQPHGGGEPLRLVRGVDIEVKRRQVVALVGESGSGKTLTALSVLGLLPSNARFSADEAMLNDRDLRNLGRADWRSLRGGDAGMVFQEPLSSLNPVLTIGDQIEEVLYYKRQLTRAQRRAEAIDLLARMGLPRPAQLLQDYPFQLSGGMRQRVMLAIAMAGEPALLIADEPTTALDNTVQAQVLELMVRTAEQSNVGVLLITHDLSVVAQVADQVHVMRHGEIVESAPVQQLFARPQAAYTQQLLALAPRIPAVVRQPLAEAALQQPQEAQDAPPILQLDAVSKYYQQPRAWHFKPFKHLALDGVSFSLQRGRTLGLVGESGSGKSSLARIIVGLAQADGGSLRFEGADLGDPAVRAAASIQMVFQDPYASLNPRMRIGQLITEPLAEQPGWTAAQLRAQAAQLLAMVGLPASALDRFAHELSGGQRQRVCIARALSVQPQLLICDEPVSALDVSVQAEILALLQRLKKDLQLSMVFIAHGLESVYAISDDIVVLEKGRVVEAGPRDQIFGAPRHAYTRSLLDAMLDIDPARSRFKTRPAEVEPDSPALARVA